MSLLLQIVPAATIVLAYALGRVARRAHGYRPRRAHAHRAISAKGKPEKVIEPGYRDNALPDHLALLVAGGHDFGADHRCRHCYWLVSELERDWHPNDCATTSTLHPVDAKMTGHGSDFCWCQRCRDDRLLVLCRECEQPIGLPTASEIPRCDGCTAELRRRLDLNGLPFEPPFSELGLGVDPRFMYPPPPPKKTSR